MAKLPKLPELNLNNIFRCSSNELPKNAVEGDIAEVTDYGKSIFIFTSRNGWVQVLKNNTNNILDELMEVLIKYPNSLIAKDIKNLLKLYEMRIYD